MTTETQEPSSAAALIDLLHALQSLKNLPRTGWRLRGMPHGESVADHCFRMAFASMLLADVLRARGMRLDVERTMRMALLHDLAECVLSDLPQPAVELLGRATKSQAERCATEKLFAPVSETRDLYGALWAEYDAGESLESTVARAADKIEMLLQALEYERAGVTGLGDFWLNVTGNSAVRDVPLFRELMRELERRRPPRLHGED